MVNNFKVRNWIEILKTTVINSLNVVVFLCWNNSDNVLKIYISEFSKKTNKQTTIRIFNTKTILPLLPTFGRSHQRQVIKTTPKRGAVDVHFWETQQTQKQITVSDLNV